jgi:hypothetical protein
VSPRSSACALAASLGLGLAACGSPQAQTFPHHRNADMVVFVTFGNARPASFDPRSPDPRVHADYTQLSQLVGHDIEFHFDDALVPQWTDFDGLFAQCLETVAADLSRLAHDQPTLFTRVAPRLQRIDVTYDATAAHDWRATADADGNVHVVLVPETSQLVPPGAVREALLEADEKAFAARFLKRGPDDVSPSEWSDYVDYLLRDGESGDSRPKGLSEQQRFESTPRAQVVLAMTRLADLVPPTDPTTTRVRKYLVEQGLDMLESAYWNRMTLVQQASPDSAWKRAEAAWMKWLLSRMPTLTDAERLHLYPHFYVKTMGADAGHFQGAAFPGLDRMALGLSVFDAWIAAGHPVTQIEGGSAPSPSGSLYDTFVCARLFRPDGTVASRPNACDEVFYRFALDGSDARARFFQYVAQKRDAALATQVFGDLGVTDDALDLWPKLSDDDASWRAATRVLADASSPDDKDRLWPEIRRQWKASPAKHGALLYLVLQIDRYHNGKVDWSALRTDLGGPVTRDDFGALLEASPQALSRAYVVLPALSTGWSRMDLLGPRLAQMAEPGRGLANLAQALCDEGNQADLAKLGAFATTVAHEKPSQQPYTSNALDVVQRCRGRTAGPVRGPSDPFR